METLLWFLKTYADHFLRTSKLSFIKQTLPLQYTITVKHWDHRPDHTLSLHFSLEAWLYGKTKSLSALPFEILQHASNEIHSALLCSKASAASFLLVK